VQTKPRKQEPLEESSIRPLIKTRAQGPRTKHEVGKRSQPGG
jgi:hypothetical protein